MNLRVLKKKRENPRICTSSHDRGRCKVWIQAPARVKIVSASGILAHVSAPATVAIHHPHPPGRGIHQRPVASSSYSYLFLIETSACLLLMRAGAVQRFVFRPCSQSGTGAALVSCGGRGKDGFGCLNIRIIRIRIRLKRKYEYPYPYSNLIWMSYGCIRIRF